MLKSPIVMFVYAAFLLACGLTAYFMAPPGADAKTALIFSAAPAGLVVICGIMALMLRRSRITGMIGIHVGLVLPLLYAVGLAMRAYKVFAGGDESKQYLAIIFTIMVAGSVIAFIAILLTRPPAAKRV